LPIEVLRKVIDEAYFIPSIRVIAFTGGEPTLHPRHLRFGIEYASKRGFITRLLTNAWWARDYNRAKEFLSELKRLGFRS
jgi:MoaA/NifB/PqqE/SkfB family radical SAM enzyme